MEFTAQQIADFIQGKVEGDSTVRVSNFSKIEEGKTGTLSFLSNPKYSQYIYDSNASIILVNEDFVAEREVKATLIRVPNAYESLAVLLSVVEQSKPRKTGVSTLSFVSESAIIGENVYIAPFVFVGENVIIGKNSQIFSNTSLGDNVTIGDNVKIYAGVHIYQDCKIGNNCILHSGAVIGSDGFGFAPSADGSYRKIPQMGNVVLEDEVEIGANTTIDRATIGSTIIKKGVKLDNLVQIAHNVEVGENTVMASQTGIAGSTKIDKQCIFGGQAGVAGHLNLAEGTILGAQSGIGITVTEKNQIFQGSPAVLASKHKRSTIVFRKLPELQNMIYELQQKVAELETKLK